MTRSYLGAKLEKYRPVGLRMTRKGRITREYIVERAAELFNSVGYYRASISDLMTATGLEKGGIYNHFASKDELAVAAFEHACRIFGNGILTRVEAQDKPLDKILALIEGFKSQVTNPPLPGGCPLLNCAVENDDGNPLLRDKARIALEKLLSFTEKLVEAAQNAGQIGKQHDAKQIATFVISSLEGGIMLSRLYQDPNRMDQVAKGLKAFLLTTTT